MRSRSARGLTQRIIPSAGGQHTPRRKNASRAHDPPVADRPGPPPGRPCPPGSGMSPPALAPHDIGRTAYYALAPDLPVSYCLFVPRTLDRERPVHLVVAVHGANRAAEACRDAFACLAEDRNAIVLAPLFPSDPLGDGRGDGYQDLDEGGLRYDLLLLRMMDKVAARYQVAFSRVALFGVETGARFAHRFMLRHPRRLSAAALCAPPAALDARAAADPEALRKLAVHLAASRPELGRPLEDAGVRVEYDAARHPLHGEARSRAFLWRHLAAA